MELAYRPGHYVKHPARLGFELWREGQWAVQRARRGWSDGDAWNFCDYIAEVIEGAVRELRQQEHGHPGGITMDEWLTILGKIEDGFKAYREWNADPANDQLNLQPKYEEGMALFAKWHPHLWD
jgi:hypothetical protein